MISETHLTSRSSADIYKYKLYRCNHPSDASHGGAAIYIKKTLCHHEVPSYRTEHIQAACVAAKLHCGTMVTLAAIYSPPRHNIRTSDYLHLFQHLGNKWIAGGDWNAKHLAFGSRLNTTKGKELNAAVCVTNSNVISSGRPTYWPTAEAHQPDCIDYFITHSVNPQYTDIQNYSDLTSDHSPLILTISDNILYKTPRCQLITKKTNWDLYRSTLHNLIDLRIPLKTPEDIDAAIASLTSAIRLAAKTATPETTTKPTTPVFYPREIHRAIQERRKARHRWQLSRDPAHKTEFNAASKRAKDLIRQCDTESFHTFVSSLDPTPVTNYSLWKVARSRNKPPSYTPPLLKDDNTLAHSDQEKADTLASYLSSTFTPNDIPTDVCTELIIPESDPIRPVTPKEVLTVIHKLRTKKAPGDDHITALMLKEAPRKLRVLLTYIINAVFRLQHVPLQWKQAKVIVIPKPGKPLEDPKSYRPISLLPVLSKVFEKIYLTRLKEVTEIPDHQFGFRNQHSTVEQVHRVAAQIREALEEKQYCPALFLDVQQAFDRVWHIGLLLKANATIPGVHVRLIQSYLDNRTFQVTYRQATSAVKPILAGVPQGSVLGPHLYLMYTADIPQPVNATLAMFADDTALLAAHKDYSTAVANLQTAATQIHQWTQRWRIKINEIKSVRIDFALRPHDYTPTILGEIPVPRTDTVKYLGVHLDEKLNWKNHILKKKEALKLAFRSLYWLFRVDNKLTLRNKRLLYLTVLKPIWTYAAPLWGTSASTNIAILQRAQNNILRKITGAPWYFYVDQLHRELDITPVAETISKLTTKEDYIDTPTSRRSTFWKNPKCAD